MKSIALLALSSFDTKSSFKTDKHFKISKENDEKLLSALINLPEREIRRRLVNGSEIWILKYLNVPHASIWLARKKVFLEELKRNIYLPTGNILLWNFEELSASSQGIDPYSTILQTLITNEKTHSRIWITLLPKRDKIYNLTIYCGFKVVGHLINSEDGELMLSANPITLGSLAGADLLNIPIVLGSDDDFLLYSEELPIVE